MALDLEEQEQVEELKAWWKQHGNTITAVVVAVAVGFAGWQGWRWYQANQAAHASTLYETLTVFTHFSSPHRAAGSDNR
jgi:predicted negative regulator of RcsB-dependent stress response